MFFLCFISLEFIMKRSFRLQQTWCLENLKGNIFQFFIFLKSVFKAWDFFRYLCHELSSGMRLWKILRSFSTHGIHVNLRLGEVHLF